MKIDILVDRYYLDIGDILEKGNVCFSPNGKIFEVSFTENNISHGVGGGVLDSKIDKEIQKKITDEIEKARKEIIDMLSKFNEVVIGRKGFSNGIPME